MLSAAEGAANATKKLVIASDHAGYELKEFLKTALPGVEWEDLGPASSERTDYPEYAARVAQRVGGGKAPAGVLLCGSGIGMCIAANKFPGVRAAVVESERTARLARQHNDANVLCLGARILERALAAAIVKAWLESDFEGGRHADRLRKLEALTRGKK